MKKSLLVAVGVVSLLGLGACSSDSNSLSVKESNSASTSAGAEQTDETAATVSDSGAESGTGTTTADDGGSSDQTVPDLSGLADSCSTYLSAFAGAMSGQDGDLGSLSSLFDSLDGKVPADLDSAVKVLSDNFGKLQSIYAKYDNDFTKAASDPDFIALFSNTEFTEASTKFNAWITAGCPTD